MTVGKRSERWKLVAIGTAFAIGGALETGFVVAEWMAKDSDTQMVEVGQDCPAPVLSGERAKGRSYMPGM